LRILTSALWHQGLVRPAGELLPLDHLLPQPGRDASVWIAADEDLPVTEPLHLLWMPPISETNGWDYQPSEIELSHIVTARLIEHTLPAPASAPPQLGVGWRWYGASILASVPVLTACTLSARQAESAPLANGQALWNMAGWCGMATVNDFLYLTATAPDSEMTVLLKRADDAVTLYYQEYSTPGWSECRIGHWPLQGAPLVMMLKHLSKAVELQDAAAPYLETGHS
jgi:hypothetical protein